MKELLELFAEILEWVWSVAAHWVVLATGGAIMAADWAIHGWRHTNMTKMEFVNLAAVFLLIACFRSWKNQRDAQRGSIKESAQNLAKKQAEIDELVRLLDQNKDLLNSKWEGEEIKKAMAEKQEAEKQKKEIINNTLGLFLREIEGRIAAHNRMYWIQWEECGASDYAVGAVAV